jgi:hypothetical protein
MNESVCGIGGKIKTAENLNTKEKNLFHGHFIHQTSEMDVCGITCRHPL